MLRKAIGAGVATVMLICLFGCGNQSETQSAPMTQTSTHNTTEASSEAQTQPMLEEVNIKRQIASNYDSTGALTGRVEQEVDKNGNVLYLSSTGSKEYRYVYEYDANGNKIKELYYTYDNADPEQAWYWEYNDRGLLIKEEDRVSTYYEVYTYDENGNKIEVFYSNPSFLDEPRDEYSRVYEYDEEGNLIKEFNQKLGEERELCRTYAYDEKGNVLKEEAYEGGEINLSIQHTYDVDGNEIKLQRQWYENGEIDTYEDYEYTYDEDGNVVKKTENTKIKTVESVYNEFGFIADEIATYTDTKTEVEYCYDEAENLISEKTVQDGKVTEWYEYTYNECGDKIGTTTYDAEGHQTAKEEYIFEYDQNGHLIRYSVGTDRLVECEYNEYGHIVRMRYMENGELVSTVEIEYEYY